MNRESLQCAYDTPSLPLRFEPNYAAPWSPDGGRCEMVWGAGARTHSNLDSRLQ